MSSLFSDRSMIDALTGVVGSLEWCRSLLFFCLLLACAVVNDHGCLVGNDFFFVFVLLVLELNADFTLPAALYFECWLDTELANRQRKKCSC